MMDLPAGNVSHCFLNSLYFWYRQCLAAPCFAKYMLCPKVFPFAGLLGNEETHLNMAPSTPQVTQDFTWLSQPSFFHVEKDNLFKLHIPDCPSQHLRGP